MGQEIGEMLSHLSEGFGPAGADIVDKIHVTNRCKDINA
jgi:hypothetical protein